MGRRGVALQQRHHRLAPTRRARALAGVADVRVMLWLVPALCALSVRCSLV